MRFLLVLLATSAHATTYHVDGVAGSDENDGINAPFRTIARAVGSLSTSDTLSLAPMDEPYRESLPLRVGGTVEAPLTIEGNGATLSGADRAPGDGWRVAGNALSLRQEQQVRFLFGPGVCYARATSRDALQPEQWTWEKGALYFRPVEGRSPADYELEMSVRVSGILTNGAGWIIARDLTCQHFFNDGFNIHGGSAPLWFERIRGVWNGDEGFSAHENCECHVRGGEFSHNQCHGIADIDYSRTDYAGITVRDNVLKGIFFIGGLHSVTDGHISGSPENIRIAASGRSDFPRFESHPIRRATTNLRNVVVDAAPGEVGVVVQAGAECAMEHCLVRGGEVGLRVAAEGLAYLLNSIIAGARLGEVVSEGTFAADHNLYHPGRIALGGESYAPEQFADYQAASGNDAHSRIAEPRFVGDSIWPSRASPATGAALEPGYGGFDIGPLPPDDRPEEDASVLPYGMTRLESGNAAIRYDFESSNPWNRVYLVPEKLPDATPTGTSELSAEQAQSGERSAKLSVHLPPAEGREWQVKLFSEKMPYHQPIVAVRFWMYGDGSGVRFRPRLRDRSGEIHVARDRAIDWEGWKEIAWDLEDEPPTTFGGDDNGRQDLPPLEVVLEVYIPGAATPTDLTLYLDSLSVELGR